MLKELGAFVESLQAELELKGCKPTDIQIEIKCKSIVEWAVLDQAVERHFQTEYPELWRRRQQERVSIILPICSPIVIHRLE